MTRRKEWTFWVTCYCSAAYYRRSMRGELLTPRYWPTWCGLACLRAFECLPYRLMMAVGRGVGRIARFLPLRYARIARCNMQLCLPQLSEAERERLLSRHFEALGMALCESAMCWWSTDRRIRGLACVEGLEHLRAALASGRGVILLTAHFTTLEIGARIMNAALPINFLYRPPRNKLLAEVAHANRGERARRAIERDDIRAMVRVLKAGEVVWYAPDQSYRKKGAAMVPFFGVPAATNTFTSRLARMTGAVVLFFSHERLPDGGGYRVRIHSAGERFAGGCEIEDTECFHRFIENEVRRIPEQYWWIHRRFKGLSADYPDYYCRKGYQERIAVRDGAVCRVR